MKRMILAALAALGMALTLAAPSSATTYGWTWAQDSVTIYNATKSKDITAALRTYEAAPIGLDVTVTTHSRDCRTNCITVDYGSWDTNAWGYAYFSVRDGQVSTCRAAILDDLRGGNPRTSPRAAAASVAVHEVGHCLGLDHTYETMSSVMTPYVSINQPKESLYAYDIADLQSLYGM